MKGIEQLEKKFEKVELAYQLAEGKPVKRSRLMKQAKSLGRKIRRLKEVENYG